MPGITCKEAVRRWEQRTGMSPAEATEVSLICQLPNPLDRMDDTLNQFENCTKLSLSTNAIDRMIALPRLKQLKILSLGRNNIKRITGLEDVAGTLEELWISYNSIDRLDGVQPCQKLHTLLISNNKIKNWDEVGRCANLAELKSILLVGNPIYGDRTR